MPLFSKKVTQKRKRAWRVAEDQAIVEFVALHSDLQVKSFSSDAISEWPTMNATSIYWRKMSDYVQCKTQSCEPIGVGKLRARVVNYFRKKGSLEEVEELFGLSVLAYQGDTNPHVLYDHQQKQPIRFDLSKLTANDKLCLLRRLASNISTEAMANLITEWAATELVGQSNVILSLCDKLFINTAKAAGITSNPADFISQSLTAMSNLEAACNSNIVYKLSRVLATKRSNSDTLLLPTDRMPFGLLSYIIDFFNCTNVNQISMPCDFKCWYETMFSEFGWKFVRLFRGPMWSGVPSENVNDPLKAFVNIPAESGETLTRNLSKSEFSIKPELQMSALDKLDSSARYWIQADACDLKIALQESVGREWNGDADLDRQKLAELRECYNRRLADVDSIADGDQDELRKQTTSILDDLVADNLFLVEGLTQASQTYQSKFDNKNTSKEALKESCWKVTELSTLCMQSQELHDQINTILSTTIGKKEVREFGRMKEAIKIYLSNVFRKKREPASHLLVFILSEERRNVKPYSIPVWYIPYNSIRDQCLRDLTSIIKEAMKQRSLTCVGTTTDGEFSSLRTQGDTRPLHIWQIIHDAKEAVRRKSMQTLRNMLIKIGERNDGRPMTMTANTDIPDEVINRLHILCTIDGLSFEGAISQIRSDLVPEGYIPYSFRTDIPETLLDKLRSIVGTYTFKAIISHWKERGVDFHTYLYVPEIDQTTSTVHHEREDHCHIIKRIAKHTREGGPQWIDVTRFDEALLDPQANLTHAALTGLRKQSVPDAERLLSINVAQFFRRMGYVNEAKYVETVFHWHEASDGRGVSQLQRCKYNYQMLNLILDELMPWHADTYDFSTIDINRPWKGILGFSRETLVAVTTNIESQELRRCENLVIGYPEHPRASTTDDTECFFSILHRHLGNTFTLKEFKYQWRKCVNEFCKKMDKDLPFYHFTANERYTNEERPSFDEIQDENLSRLHRLSRNRREDSSIFVAGRSFLPIRDMPTIRQRLHRHPVQLPPINDNPD